ncbi:hypothetical protein AA23498_3087 [Acetobacter nitrogenifigens DSM 23921 = NBRC 105050]|uniref:Uncharacterized protein n=1 Tax=Acetobacter nitrogenifigens DSM 23921 = NBRC 105050 TaxID=1120919 RepID=A0A511X9V8_9PROT|nr:hypothetical protein [Acetobacter nitrogenifigens]GBQ98059.1 hypothetical protein AA23498_3087 [Acetobacter nitrogenifigens DSM 23921 = NBRC 105050]GEN59705.1 hypothetical protein ANI02nite_15890 [Acetobacter nitrogenifigens DSM 23921 = NBRC 105050]
MTIPDPSLAADELIRLFGEGAKEIALKYVGIYVEQEELEMTESWLGVLQCVLRRLKPHDSTQ